MVQHPWTVENELSIRLNGATVGKFAKTVKRENAPHEKTGDKVIIPIGISDDNNTTTRSFQGEVVDVQDKCPVGRFVRHILLSNLDDVALHIGDLEDRLVAKGWRKISVL